MGFKDLNYHEKINCKLEKLSESKNIPHIILYGPPGSGKTTRAMCFLENMYGPGVYSKRRITTSIDGIDVLSVSSNYHIEIDLSTIDKDIIYEYLKNMSSGNSIMGPKFVKTLFIKNTDELNIQVQSGLRRTMEDCTKTCMMILECRHYDKIISPIVSRCVPFRIPSPTCSEVNKYKGDLSRMNRCIIDYDWEELIKTICDSLFVMQDARRLYLTRDSISDLLESHIPPYVILYTMEKYFLSMLNNMMSSEKVIDNAKTDVSIFCREFEYRTKVGDCNHIHIEAFLAKCMSIIKNMDIDI